MPDPDTAKLVSTVKDRIAETDKADASHWPVPVYCFGGSIDKVVPEASARGPFSNYTPIPGDHFTILRPYLDAGYVVTRSPAFYLNPVDVGTCDACGNLRQFADLVPPIDVGTPRRVPVCLPLPADPSRNPPETRKPGAGAPGRSVIAPAGLSS